ncbi:CPBP family intramembrane glutamic endopeptidase [Streptococcus catagoni]|uniref:CPBP family intramembrane glutamic endopeptidase n=1 Tax=Streptococcus catagoni TaxID=2654874 RepID=UPI00140DC51C|nr:CPBP family intramembrane glutamic endopeptidase [Streptococcus catagoni]
MQRDSLEDEVFITVVTAFLCAGMALFLMWKKEDFKPKWEEKGKVLLYLVFCAPLVAITLFCWISYGSFSKEFIIPIIVAIFVGFGEELLYRRIVFIGLYNDRSLKQAVIISTAIFSLSHAFNIIGANEVKPVIMQVIMTFMSGLFYALIYKYTKNIFLLIIEHAMWDYILINFAEKVEFIAVIMVTLTVVRFLLTIFLIWKEKANAYKMES